MPSQVEAAASIRNVALVGHGGSGKTALAETLLAGGGGPDARAGVLDWEPEERERGCSLSLSLASVDWGESRINLIDTPGGPDALGDAYAALRAADVAVFVVDAAAGVQAQHDQLWEVAARLGLPRIVFLNKLDKDNAGYQRNIDALRERCGKPLAPVHMPIGVEAGFTGVIDLLHFTAVMKVDGRRTEVGVPDERVEQAQRNRETLVEAIVENDDALLERYLDGDEPDAKELGRVLARGIASCGFFPVLCGAAAAGLGVRLLADFIVNECPSPVERAPVRGAEGAVRELDGPAAMTVFKTVTDPYVGRISMLRGLAGSVARDDHLVVARTGRSVRVGALFTLCGKEQTPTDRLAAGDIAAVAKFEDVRTGDVLHAADAPFDLPAMETPAAFHRVGVAPVTAGDEEKLSSALARLTEEDPALHLDRDPETRQLVVRGLGPAHVDVALARLARKFGVDVKQVPVRIAYRETLKGAASAVGKHVKQSGGHGQYGIAHIEVEPLGRGEGFEFEDRIVGGVIPRQWIPAVEKGIIDTMASGVLAGYPVVDVRVRLVDGKHHSVDSSDFAFQMAGSLAFRNAAEQAGMVLLEPIMDVAVTVPDDLTGDVMGDLSSRRGRIHGTDSTGEGHTTVRALVPQAELGSYVGELRSLTSGAGTVGMRYDHHDLVPEQLAARIIDQSAEAS